MTRRKKSNVCPVCRTQGRLRVSVDYFEGVEFVEYIVTCKCPRKPVAMPSKAWAWWWFRNWRTVKMRDFKNYWRRADIWRRNDIRGGRLTRAAIGQKLHNARLRNS